VLLAHSVCLCFVTVKPLIRDLRPGGRTRRPVSLEPGPSREELESQARRLLEQARERTGASVERLVQTFGELQPRGAVTRRSWYDWQERPETVSLLTGLAAMHALGPEASMELVFGEAAGAEAGVDSATRDARIDQLQSAVEDAMTELMQLRERMEGFVVPELQRQGELLATVLAVGKTRGPRSRRRTRRPKAEDEPPSADDRRTRNSHWRPLAVDRVRGRAGASRDERDPNRCVAVGSYPPWLRFVPR
jgi:hypothetical protein